MIETTLVKANRQYRQIKGETYRALIIEHELKNLPTNTPIELRAKRAKEIGEALKPLVRHHLMALYNSLPIDEPTTIISPQNDEIGEIFQKAKEMSYG